MTHFAVAVSFSLCVAPCILQSVLGEDTEPDFVLGLQTLIISYCPFTYSIYKIHRKAPKELTNRVFLTKVAKKQCIKCHSQVTRNRQTFIRTNIATEIVRSASPQYS